jgi:acetylornithine deacetylase/succinyl-diaminopimelate desuccinylase-like protein
MDLLHPNTPITTTPGLPPLELLRADMRDFMLLYPSRLQRLVDISSSTEDLPGLWRVADEFKAIAHDMLDTPQMQVPITTFRLADAKGKVRPFLLIGSKQPKTIYLAHLDTVQKLGDHNRFSHSGGLFSGNGPHDNKGAAVIALGAMQELQNHNPDVFGDTALFISTQEEKGSSSARGLIESICASASLAIGMEGAEMSLEGGKRQPYRIKVGRKSAVCIYIDYWIEPDIPQKVHSGYVPYERADANRQMAFHLRSINEWMEDHQLGNIGIVKGGDGDGANAVSGSARLGFEARAWDDKVLWELVELVKNLPHAASCPGVKWDAEIIEPPAPWKENAQSQGAFEIVKEISESLGLIEVESEVVAGVGDINHTLPHMTRIDGLGGQGGNDHSLEGDDLVEATVPDAVLLTYGAAAEMTGLSPREIAAVPSLVRTLS